MIRSKHAEIIYYCSPEYIGTSLPAAPVPFDVEGDEDPSNGLTGNGFPDRIRLHRRVLLIRPDLNISTSGQLPAATQTNGTINVNFMSADTWPTATANITVGAVAADAWLYGLAGSHQQCDLSIRRALDGTGSPTTGVAANSLEDLAIPPQPVRSYQYPGDRVRRWIK